MIITLILKGIIAAAAMEGHSLEVINLRGRTGVTIIAVQRVGAIHQNPSSDFVLRDGDIILLIGKREDITRAIGYFESEIK